MDVIKEFQDKLNKILESVRGDIQGMRANRPTTALVEGISVEHYGAKTPIEHLTSISVSPPREIVVKVWDADAVPAVSKAIEKSDLGLSPNIDDDGQTIRLFLPELSNERREEIISHMKKKVEEYRIQVRQAREYAREKVDQLFKEDEIGEDDKFRMRDQIQEETDSINQKMSELLENKKKQINS